MRRARKLSVEEARLWAGVARTAIPLKGKSQPPAPEAPPPALIVSGAGELAGVAAPVVPPRPARPHPQHPIERNTRRKIGKGRIAIEARIDLHEMSQSVAHFALGGFLRQAQAAGLRHVLVITGRGASFGSRGVLRRAVPQWFATPEFRPLVAGFEPAERGHGGVGAFYVRVRR